MRSVLLTSIALWAPLLWAQQAPAPTASVVIHADQPGPTIDRHIYGQFAEHLGRGIYEGVWVGEHSPIPNTRGFRNDVVAALRDLHVPVVRWPGGCFADEYHWRDGIGPRAKRRTNQRPAENENRSENPAHGAGLRAGLVSRRCRTTP